MTIARPVRLVTPSADELETIVDVRGVTRRFRVGDQDVWAVRDVSLHVGRGSFVALMGRSGSGKTTLLNLLAGLDRPDSGAIRLAGQDITSASEPELLEVRRHTIGFVFQSFGLLPLLSAFENVEVALRIAGVGRNERRERAQELLRLVDLHARSDHRPYELSGGEQQRVAIARALANRPALVVADEPTGELDHANARAIFQLMQDLVRQSGVTIVTATHDRTVLDYADRVEEMADGRILEHHERDLTADVRADIAPGARGPAGSPPPAGDGADAAAPAPADAAPAEAPPASLPVAPNFRPPPGQRAPWARD